MSAADRPAVGPVRLADALGWASAALGAPMLAAPRRFLRAIGVREDHRAVAWTVGVGAREQLALLNIVANRQRRIGMWSRVAGDSMDLVLLGAAYANRRGDGTRLRRAIAIVTGFLAVDLAVAAQLTRAEVAFAGDGSESSGQGVDHDTGGGPLRVRTAVTIRRAEDEVRRTFREHDWGVFDPAALEAAGDVRFTAAPGDRGTEVHIDHEPSVAGSPLGAVAAKAAGRAPDQRISDELRRFKAQLETGTVPRSETSPEGVSSARQIMHKRAAQPAGTES